MEVPNAPIGLLAVLQVHKLFGQAYKANFVHLSQLLNRCRVKL